MATATPERITVGTETVQEARQTNQANLSGSHFVLHLADGTKQILPDNLQQALLSTLQSLASNGRVIIGQLPEELTTTVAANVLGVSRPTLKKWAQQGDIESHKVVSHLRFRLSAVLALKEQRSQERKEAFAELGARDIKLDENFEA